MSVAKLAFEKANKRGGDEGALLYLQSIAASLLDISEALKNGGKP